MFHECDTRCGEYYRLGSTFKDGWIIDKYKFDRCPLDCIDSSVYFWLTAHTMYKNGNLPNGIDWLNQTWKFISVMMFIDNEYALFNKERIENGKERA